jgi:tetratricopeptide (TPR) repeat protein
MEICPFSSILNIMLYKIKNIFSLFIIILLMGCNNKTELAIERGIQYYEWDMIEKAVLEFKYVIHSLGLQYEKMDYEDIRLLSRAHYNLAVAYARKKWYNDAIDEAEKAFELFPTDDNRKVLELIQTKMFQKTELKPAPIDPTNP